MILVIDFAAQAQWVSTRGRPVAGQNPSKNPGKIKLVMSLIAQR